ncbi:hypothetical protein EJ110_NYTH58058 [Nymphaea thermarum]|nr:hypothetical protein EJ110_NYTH58058 [Nymphaea thermarum]
MDPVPICAFCMLFRFAAAAVLSSSNMRLSASFGSSPVCSRRIKLRWQLKLRKVSVWLAFVGVLCTALLFIPVSRGSAILKVAGLSFEENIRYHIWLGHMAMAVFIIHGLFYVIIWASKNNLHEVSCS